MQTEAGVHSVNSYLASMRLAVRDSTQIDIANVVSGVTGMPERFSGQAEEMRASGRIASKLAAGTLSGIGFAIVGGFVFVTTEDCSGYDSENTFGPTSCALGLLSFMYIGYVVGVPVGVSMWDPHDQFIASLGGSLGGAVVGSVVGLMMSSTNYEDYGGWPLLMGPVVFSTIASERFRNIPETPRFSIGLKPDLRGHVSAVSILRF